VIRYSPERTPHEGSVTFGSFGSMRGSFSTSLNVDNAIKQSISVDVQKQAFPDSRELVQGGSIYYRATAPLVGGILRLDMDIVSQKQIPPSPVVRDGNVLTTLTPLDHNYDPIDAEIKETRYHAVAGYSHDTRLGTWQTTASAAYSDIGDIRGFLRPELVNDGTANADSQRQSRKILDVYLDSHFSKQIAPQLALVYGTDLLYGIGKQTSRNGEYYASLTGKAALPSTQAIHVDEANSINDRRIFVGQYIQADYKPDARWDVNGGIRLGPLRIYRHTPLEVSPVWLARSEQVTKFGKAGRTKSFPS
jgi:hypothetical protein